MIYLSNAFSLSMLDRTGESRTPRPVTLDEVIAIIDSGFTSCVGHANTAADFSAILGTEVVENRVSVKLTQGDKLVVGQFVGARLEEGAKELPASAKFEWWVI